MKTPFNKKVAKDIALTSFGYVIDCLLGHGDMGYDLDTPVSEFEQNFTEDMEEKNIIVTNKRITVINTEYEKMQTKLSEMVSNFYDKHNKPYKTNNT